MPRGDKSSYTDKQKRMAEHIEESVEKRGGSKEQAERIGWATVNKYTGGGRKSSAKSTSSRSTTKKSAAKKRTTKRTGPAKTKGSTHAKLSKAGQKGAARAGSNIKRETAKASTKKSSATKKAGSSRKISASTRQKLSAAGKKGAAARKRKAA
jgi:hypothetical protein